MNKTPLIQQVAKDVTKELTDQGKLIEAGFAALRHLAMAKDAPPIQVEEMRFAFMAGAQHLFSSIMVILDPGSEPTEKDLQRMDLIHNELEQWVGKLSERVQPAKGRA
jgi:hypothetical protein